MLASTRYSDGGGAGRVMPAASSPAAGLPDRGARARARRPGGADVDEAGDAFALDQAQVGLHDRIEGHPGCQPLCAEAQRLRGLQQGEADAAGGHQLLLLGHLRVRARAGHHHDHHRGVAETLAVLLEHGLAGMRVALAAAFGQEVAQSVTCIAGDLQEAERYALAVVGHAYGRRQHPLQRGRVRPGSPSCREGTERRASRASRAAGSGMESEPVITGVDYSRGGQ